MLAHTPVLLTETIGLLDPQPGDTCVDATVGAGGHARALLERTAPDGRLLAVDLDAAALALARQTLAPFGDRVTYAHGGSDSIAHFLSSHQFPQPQCILADLGLSSMELADQNRGFSFQHIDSPLDMRFNAAEGVTAADLLNTAREDDLVRIIDVFGGESRARAIAKAIVTARETTPFSTVGDLIAAIGQVYRGRRGAINPATKTFQAIRIAVNDEVGRLERFLAAAVSTLAPGGRLAVITFHSLEDRIVKQFFRDQAAQGTVDILTKHPVTPGFAETTKNPRSRSAKLRVTVRKSHQ